MSPIIFETLPNDCICQDNKEGDTTLGDQKRGDNNNNKKEAGKIREKRDNKNLEGGKLADNRKRDNEDLDTAAVLFVDNTKDGGLASKLRKNT